MSEAIDSKQIIICLLMDFSLNQLSTELDFWTYKAILTTNMYRRTKLLIRKRAYLLALKNIMSLTTNVP